MNIKSLLNIIFPKNYTCVICGDETFNKYSICTNCLKTLPYITGRVCLHCADTLVSGGDYCKRCKGKVFYYDRAISPFVYDGDIVNLIRGLKYSNKKYLSKPLAVFMADKYMSEKLYADFAVPVPLCEKRFKTRGFNQSLLLGVEFSKITGISIKDNILFRVKETPSQTSLKFIERQKNLKDAFKVKNKKEVKDKCILLIDDVFTTGATVTECAKVLKEAGANCVYVITVAHTNKQTDDNLVKN